MTGESPFQIGHFQRVSEWRERCRVGEGVKMYYYSDPFSVDSYMDEMVLFTQLAESGLSMDIEYRIGELDPNASQAHADPSVYPVIMAQKWFRAGDAYQLPFSGKVWLFDPPSSAAPIAKAFKAAQLQSESAAQQFYMRLREALFFEGVNTTRWEAMQPIATECGLNIDQLQRDIHSVATNLYHADLASVENLQIVGFPAFVFPNISRYTPYRVFYSPEQAVRWAGL